LVDARRALDRLAVESKRWKKQGPVREAAVDVSGAAPKSQTEADAKSAHKSAAEPTPAADLPPDAPIADSKAEQTASIPNPPNPPPRTRNEVRTEKKPVAEKPVKTQVTTSRVRHDDRPHERNIRDSHNTSKNSKPHEARKDERRTQKHTVEVRRPQVRYYYVERRPARFTDLFR
jgi:hypothetical protein